MTARQRYEASAKGQRTRAAYNAAKRAEINARNNARRVAAWPYYVGMAPTVEIAQSINDETRREFHDRKNTSAA